MRRKTYVIFREMGFKPSTAHSLARLITHRSTSEERKRWKKLGVIDSKNRIVLSSESDAAQAQEFILFGLVWEGLVIRTKR